MNKNRKLINALLVSTMMLSGLALDVSAAEAGAVTRLGGETRVETSVEVSKAVYGEKADNVVITGFAGQADALTGTILAANKKAPLLLAKNYSDVKEEVNRLEAKNVYLLGGTSVVSDAFKAEVEADGKTVVRIGGDNRWETAVKMAEQIGTTHKTVFLTNDGVGTGSLADALAVGPVSGDKQIPVLLTAADKMPAETVQALTDFEVEEVIIVGGNGAVSEEVAAVLKAKDITVTDRVAGDTRWETATEIAAKYFGDSKEAIIANDGVFSPIADALMGGYLGASKSAPILLTPAGSLNKFTESYLGGKAMHAYVLGETGAISAATEAAVKTIVDENVEAEKGLKVESVSAINSKNVEVKFNKEVKEVKPANFKVTDKDGNLLFVSKAELNEAKNVATLSFFDAFADKGVYTVETSNVADVDGNVMAKSTDQFGYEKAEVAKVEFTATTIKEGENLKDYVKVTDKLGRDVTEEHVVEFASANPAIISNGIAQVNQDGKEVLVTATVKDTTVTAKSVIKVSQSSAKTFVGYTTDGAVDDTDAFNKLEADKVYDYVSISDTDTSAKNLVVYALDQYGKSMNKVTTFASVQNLTPNVVIVDSNGKITPISEGTGYAKVKFGDVEQTVKIDVRAEAQVKDIEVDPTEVNVVEKGLAGEISLTYKNQFGSKAAGDAVKLTVKSSDATVAKATKVDANTVKVEGLKKGTANVTLTYKYKVNDKETIIEKTVPVTVAEKGNFADYTVEVPRTTLYDENDPKTEFDDTKVEVKAYEIDDKGQKIANATISLVALDEDEAGKTVEVTNDADNNRVKISGTTVSFKKEGTQSVRVKVGNVVIDTIEFTSVDKSEKATSVDFKRNDILFDNIKTTPEGNAVDEEKLKTALKDIIQILDQDGKVMKDESGDIKANDVKFTLTNANGLTIDNNNIAKLSKAVSTVDLVVTEVKAASGGKNLLTTPTVIKVSVKQNVKELDGEAVKEVTVDSFNGKFLVAGLVANDTEGPQVASDLNAVKTFIDNKYNVNFNKDAITIGEDGKVSITGTILSTSDWYKVKENGNNDMPYRITLDGTSKKVKIAMYADGTATIEDTRE